MLTLFCFSVELCLNTFFVLSYSISANEKEVEVSLNIFLFPFLKSVSDSLVYSRFMLLHSCPTLGNDQVQVKSMCANTVLLRRERNASV